jgi:hypothetical protein
VHKDDDRPAVNQDGCVGNSRGDRRGGRHWLWRSVSLAVPNKDPGRDRDDRGHQDQADAPSPARRTEFQHVVICGAEPVDGGHDPMVPLPRDE